MRSIQQIKRTGPRTSAEQKRLWKDRDKRMREADREGTRDYMDRMDAPSHPRKRNPTKAQKREKARKASVQRRVAAALAKYLKQQNPGTKLAGAKVQKLKGGVLKITPIKAARKATRGRR